MADGLAGWFVGALAGWLALTQNGGGDLRSLGRSWRLRSGARGRLFALADCPAPPLERASLQTSAAGRTRRRHNLLACRRASAQTNWSGRARVQMIALMVGRSEICRHQLAEPSFRLERARAPRFGQPRAVKLKRARSSSSPRAAPGGRGGAAPKRARQARRGRRALGDPRQ